MKCEEVEREVFTMTRRGIEQGDESRGPLGADGQGEGGQSDVEQESGDDDGGVSVRLPSNTEPPAATTTTMRPKSEKRPHKALRDWGMQKAKEREMVRQAARRGVAFGFEMEDGKRRNVEAVQRGRVVESSFAKGEWGVRWRE